MKHKKKTGHEQYLELTPNCVIEANDGQKIWLHPLVATKMWGWSSEWLSSKQSLYYHYSSHAHVAVSEVAVYDREAKEVEVKWVLSQKLSLTIEDTRLENKDFL